MGLGSQLAEREQAASTAGLWPRPRHLETGWLCRALGLLSPRCAARPCGAALQPMPGPGGTDSQHSERAVPGPLRGRGLGGGCRGCCSRGYATSRFINSVSVLGLSSALPSHRRKGVEIGCVPNSKRQQHSGTKSLKNRTTTGEATAVTEKSWRPRGGVTDLDCAHVICQVNAARRLHTLTVFFIFKESIKTRPLDYC